MIRSGGVCHDSDDERRDLCIARGGGGFQIAKQEGQMKGTND